MAAMRRNSLMQGHFCSGRRSKQVLPPWVIRRAASKCQILEVLRGRFRVSPDAAIAAVEADHSEVGVRLCCGSDAQRQVQLSTIASCFIVASLKRVVCSAQSDFAISF